MTLLCGFTTSSMGDLEDVAKARYSISLVVGEFVVHDSSLGAKSAAGCATSSENDVKVVEVLLVVVLVVVLLFRLLPSCFPRSAKSPASLTVPPLGASVDPARCLKRVAPEVWNSRTMERNAPTRKVVRKNDRVLHPITASLPTFITAVVHQTLVSKKKEQRKPKTKKSFSSIQYIYI